MRDCNQSAQINATLSKILEAILNQSEKLNDQTVPLESACFLVGAENMVLTPVVTLVDGLVTATQYFNESGVLHTGVAPVAASPCDCPCPECDDILWRVDDPDASWSQMTDWGFDSGSLPNGDSGAGLTNFEAALTGAGYIVTNAANSPLIVKEAATTGKPTNFKWVNTNGKDFANDWVLV